MLPCLAVGSGQPGFFLTGLWCSSGLLFEQVAVIYVHLSPFLRFLTS